MFPQNYIISLHIKETNVLLDGQILSLSQRIWEVNYHCISGKDSDGSIVCIFSVPSIEPDLLLCLSKYILKGGGKERGQKTRRRK